MVGGAPLRLGGMRRGFMMVVGVILLGASAPTASLRPGSSPEPAPNAATRWGDVTADGVTTALDGLAILTNSATTG